MTQDIALTHVGLDVHKDSISVALLRPHALEVDEDRIPNTPEAIRTLIRRWGEPAAVRVCYEAGPCGYELQRNLARLGIDCQVIAPALIPKRQGERVKTDRRDAEHRTALELRLAQRDRIERELLAIAAAPPYAEAVRRLSGLRGIRALTALTLLVEVGDFARFASAPAFMAFTGLVPSEHSSGGSRHLGGITKTGNAHLRRVLVEAAWAYRARPRSGRERMARLDGQPAAVIALALASEQRLHARYWRIVNRGKRTTVAAVAVARELAGVIWAVMQQPVAA